MEVFLLCLCEWRSDLDGVLHPDRLYLIPQIARQAFEERFAQLRARVADDVSLAVGADWLADAAELDEAISKTDRRMYRDKVAHYEQVGKKELPRHEFYLTVKKFTR